MSTGPVRTSHLDYAVVSNGRVLALIGPDSSVDWLCLPRFDSPSVFGAVLDRDLGGRCAVRMTEGQYTSNYIDGSNLLDTHISGPTGVVRVRDFCPVGHSALVRIVEPISGHPNIELELDPRWNYGGSLDAGPVQIGCSVPLDGRPITLREPVVVVVSDGGGIEPSAQAAGLAFDDALARDHAFVASLRSDLPPAVVRSALVLHALTDAETGAMLAAATTSIPEAVGEPRNWDYRFAWIRDGCFAAEALLQLGHHETANRLLDFFRRATGDGVDDGGVQPVFTIHGKMDMPERVITHLLGFESTRPVRVGNAAALQHQHDAYGQLVWLAARLDRDMSEDRWEWLATLVDMAAVLRNQPDAGIWEFRDRPGRYTTSRAWIWVALDRGARMARARGQNTRAEAWSMLASEERAILFSHAGRAGFFAQTLDNDTPDAASLFLSSIGVVAASHPLFQQTVERCEAALAIGGMMRRYVAEDDFGRTTSVFNLCTLWWAEALARMGRTDQAQATLDRFLTYGNPHGLFSEDVDPATGRLLGNFPQAYTHTGIIKAWLAIEASRHPAAEG